MDVRNLSQNLQKKHMRRLCYGGCPPHEEATTIVNQVGIIFFRITNSYSFPSLRRDMNLSSDSIKKIYKNSVYSTLKKKNRERKNREQKFERRRRGHLLSVDWVVTCGSIWLKFHERILIYTSNV